MPDSAKRILVTGGAGFIGSHLCLRLLRGPGQASEVIALDNLSLGREEFLSQCREFKNFRFVKGNLLDFENLLAVMKGVDQVWHLAANSDIAEGAKHTDVDLKVGTLSTYNVLEAMRLTGCKSLIFSSTSAVYGEAEVKPTPETYGPCLPISLYGASKLGCEALVTAFAHNFDMQAWIYRFANIVGSHSTHGVIYDFVKKLLKNGTSLEVLGDGQQAKSYLHVRDCIDAMLFGVERSRDEVNLFNLASRGQCQVHRIADFVVKAANERVPAKIIFTGGSRGWKGDVPQVLLDGKKLKDLGFEASLASEEAVRLAVQEVSEELGLTR